MAKLTIYKYVRTDKGWRYCKAAFHPNGKIKPNVVLVGGVEEKHTEGRYFLGFNNRWIEVGTDALEAQRKRLLRLNQMEYARLSGRSLGAAAPGQPSTVEFTGRKVIKDEVDAYLANLELAKVHTGQSNRSAASSKCSFQKFVQRLKPGQWMPVPERSINLKHKVEIVRPFDRLARRAERHRALRKNSWADKLKRTADLLQQPVHRAVSFDRQIVSRSGKLHLFTDLKQHGVQSVLTVSEPSRLCSCHIVCSFAIR